MSKRFEQTLATLQEAVKDPAAPGARAPIVRALKGKNGMLVGIAAKAAVSGDDDDPTIDQGLVDLLPAAFERLTQDPVKRDPQCGGKVAIAKALRWAGRGHEEVFLAGVRYMQYEPVWGGRVETAAELRGVSSMALVEQHHPRAMVAAAQLLADPETAARTAAARALGASGRAEVAEPLLRLRIEAGEAETDVLGECFGALLQLAPRESLDYVAGFLGHEDDGMAEAAALALGESRLDGAFAPLAAQVERTLVAERRGVILLAIAMLRTDPAWSYLLERVEDGGRDTARAALRALGAFGHDDRLRQRAAAAVESRPDDSLAAAFEEIFA